MMAFLEPSRPSATGVSFLVAAFLAVFAAFLTGLVSFFDAIFLLAFADAAASDDDPIPLPTEEPPEEMASDPTDEPSDLRA